MAPQLLWLLVPAAALGALHPAKPLLLFAVAAGPTAASVSDHGISRGMSAVSCYTGSLDVKL
eukprot:6305950-Amphidinium_carterae.1